ncbi:imidazole glycerol phosphate synthase subunit HisH [Aliivibrio salmonicida]|uniref:imidazole glycerol phosphate synthase subunit HisH n=1 Tax=Aliivibrio salmonicida TaxID=40269 RepID=UPI00406D3410
MKNVNVAIVNTGLGNVGSVFNMIKKAGGKPILVSNPDELDFFDKIVLPGVGTFDNGMTRLIEQGFDIVIKEQAKKGKYILGICLGMQMLTEGSEEGLLSGLGIIKGSCKKFNSSLYDIKIPHMGWNKVMVKDHYLFEGIDEPRFYFVHSFYVNVENDVKLVESHHGHDFTCGIHSGNVVGLQFHPEKSHKFGLKLFSNFLGK